MQGFGIFLIVVIAFWVLWPPISRWLGRKAREKTEDYIRQSMGLPPRPGSRRDRRERRGRFSGVGENHREREARNRRKPIYTAAIIRVYAEDVEYEEYFDNIGIERNLRKIRWITPGELIDVKWEEIRRRDGSV